MTDKIRVVLADDHTLLRKGLRALLNNEADMEVIAEAGDGAEAVRACQRLSPDVIVMDLSMPNVDGMQATAQIRDLGLDTRVLVLTMHNEEEYLLKVLEAGGAGYVLKQSADTELVHAIRAVHRGEAFLYPRAFACCCKATCGAGTTLSLEKSRVPHSPNGSRRCCV